MTWRSILKIRTGPSPERRNGVTIARIAEEAGVAALAVHGVAAPDAPALGGVQVADGWFTAADVPGKRNQGLIKDDWNQFVAVGETTHYVGDVLAVVVAWSAC